MPEHSEIYRVLQYQKERMENFLRNPGTMNQRRRLEVFEDASKLIIAYDIYTQHLEATVAKLKAELGYETEQ